MTTTESKLQLTKKLLDVEDKRILKAIKSILEPEEDNADLTPAQKKDLDKRLADHKAGKLNYHTIDEVRKAVLKVIKK